MLVLATLSLGLGLLMPAGGDTDKPYEPAILVVVVVDATGAMLPGAKVEVQQDKELQSKETDLPGLVRFWLLPKRKVNVAVSLMGFTSVRRKGVSLERRGATVIGFTLSLPEHCGPKVQICM